MALSVIISTICAQDTMCINKLESCVDQKVWEREEVSISPYTEDIPFICLAECVQENHKE
jgi:hypothetical protein